MNIVESVQKGFCRSVRWLKAASPTILTCVGVAGVGVTAVLTGKAVPKAVRLMEEAECEKGEELTVTEKIIASIPAYAPAAISGIVTVLCIVSANIISKRQQASLASACIAVNNMFKEYKSTVKKLYGEETEKEIMADIIKDKSGKEPPADGKMLFYEPYYGSFFESTMLDVRNAEYHLNRNFILREYASLNEFYEFLGLEKTEAGEALGWSIDAGLEFYGYQWIDFEHELVTVDDDPELQCYIITYPFEPTENYW